MNQNISIIKIFVIFYIVASALYGMERRLMKIVQILNCRDLEQYLLQLKIYLYLQRVLLKSLILFLQILEAVISILKAFITHLKKSKIFHLWRIKNALFSSWE